VPVPHARAAVSSLLVMLADITDPWDPRGVRHPLGAALGIENLEHRPRDTVWREDDQQARHGNGPRAMATLRNLALGLFAIHGITQIKQTVQSIGRNPLRAVPLIT
jgi:hypothetical protein